MSILSRVNYTPQQRLDLQDLLMQESFTAFDFRALISSFVGIDSTYIARGFEVVSKSGLSIQIKVADSLVFNPKDGTGSFYLGLPSDANITVDLPSQQANIFIEGKFSTVSQAPVNKGLWDPLALTGEDASGTEFTSAINTQVVMTLSVSVNTVGFSEGAIPLARASTSASAITSMKDSRPMLFRLGSGGTSPNPLNKYAFGTSRSESVGSGTGVADAVDSPWRARDSVGALNDKAFKSFKDWADAVMTRISEISGSSIWYSNGIPSAIVNNLSLNELFFDTVGHSIQPDANASFIWKDGGSGLILAGEGTKTLTLGVYQDGLIQWKANYHHLKFHLGDAFAGANTRSYSSVRFSSPVPDDGGNVYLSLEREVAKGSGNDLSWADNSGVSGVFPTATKVVKGVSGDFVGIALGDYIRKESEGYSRYYRVQKATDGTLVYNQSVAADANKVISASDGIIALELADDTTSGPTLTNSTEPLRYFRSRYSSNDLVADTNIAANGFQYQDANCLWLGRRVGNLFNLDKYGTLQENEEVTTLNDAFGSGGEAANLILEQSYDAVYDTTNGYKLKSGATTTLLTIRRRKSDNTTDTPSSGNNSGASLTYTINAPVGVMSDGDGLWVRLSDSTSGTLSSGSVTNTSDDLDNLDAVTNLWEVRSATNNVKRTYDNRDVFLLARKQTIGGQACLIFVDGTVLSSYGQYVDNHLEIQGNLKLDLRPTKAVLFTNDTVAGQVDDDVANFFYDKPALLFGIQNLRIPAASGSPLADSIYQNTARDFNFLPTIGNNTLTLGGASSTTYIPGDLLVAGNTVAAQVSQIQSEDKIITLGVGNALNGGYASGIEVADNTKTASSFSSTSGSPNVILTFSSAPTYASGDIIGISAVTGIGGITAGEIGGQYTVVSSSPTTAGQAQVSGSTLIIRTAVSATSTASSSTTPPKSFKPEWAIKVSGADGNLGSAIQANSYYVGNGSAVVDMFFSSAPLLYPGEVIFINTYADLNGIPSSVMTGPYTIVTTLTGPGQAIYYSANQISFWTYQTATSSGSDSVNPPSYTKFGTGATGVTSWQFQVKGVTTTPTITPVNSYGVVPTAHSVNMQSTRIPFVNDDNQGPSNGDSTLNFSANLTWNNSTNILSVIGGMSLTGNFTPGVDDLYDLGTSTLRWRKLYLGDFNDSGIVAGTTSNPTNLYWASADRWKTDDAFEIDMEAYFNTYTSYNKYSSPSLAPVSSSSRVNTFASGDLMWQRTSDGDTKLLTNINGNVYEELVAVSSTPSGNNQMAPVNITTTLVGVNLTASTTSGSTTVSVSKTGHGLISGNYVTVDASTAIGGIDPASLSQVAAQITVVDANTFTYEAPYRASSTTSGVLGSVYSQNVSVITLPKDHRHLVGSTLSVSVSSGSAIVTVTKNNHGLAFGDAVSILTSTAIGGISAANLSVANVAILNTVTTNTFQYTAYSSASVTTTGTLDTVNATTTRYYTVGSSELELYLNGDYLRNGGDWKEQGSVGSLSNTIQLNIPLVAGDRLAYRIDSNGGQYVINASGGTTLQAAYAAGNSVTIASGSPLTLLNGGPAGQKLLYVAGNVQIDGVIDPTAITFTPQSFSPLASSEYGLYVDFLTKDLLFARGTGLSTVNLAGSYVTLANNTGSTITKGTPVRVDTSGDLQTISVSSAAQANAFIGVASEDISNGSTGQIYTGGVIKNITTTAAFGDSMWVSKTGTLTNTKPSIGVNGFLAGDYVLKVGVISKNQANSLLKDLILSVQNMGTL